MNNKDLITNNILSSTLDVTNNKERTFEQLLRPQLLKDFIGQDKIKMNLEVFIQASLQRKEALDHCIFYGPPGLGKTSLAQIVSNEIGTNFRSISGPAIAKAADLAAILTNLNEKDVLFIDEIHRLSSTVEEILYSAMEDFCIDIIIGEGPSARSIKIDLKKFTLIGATTRFGMVSKPLRDRFGIPLRLNFYSNKELVEIIKRAAKVNHVIISECGASEIAKRSRGTPRVGIRLLNRVRDFALVENQDNIDAKMADYSLNRLEVDTFGLDSNDYRYIKFISTKYNGGPVGIETIAAGLAEQRDSIEDVIEPYLIQIGFLNRTSRGRILTEVAKANIQR